MNTITVTKDDLSHALQKWDSESKGAQWAERADEDRFNDSAEYLFNLLASQQPA